MRWIFRILAVSVILLFVGGIVTSKNDQLDWRWKLLGNAENNSQSAVTPTTASKASAPQSGLSPSTNSESTLSQSTANKGAGERATSVANSDNPLRQQDAAASVSPSSDLGGGGGATGDHASQSQMSSATLDEELTEPVSIEEFLRGDTGGERARLLGMDPMASGAEASAMANDSSKHGSRKSPIAGVDRSTDTRATSALESDQLEFTSTDGGDAGLLKLARQLQRDGRMPQDFRRRDRSRLPNIMLVVVENLSREDIGAYGQPLIRTPYLDRLAAAGLRLTQCAGSSVGRTMERTALWYGDLSHATRPGNAKLLRLPRPDLPAELIRAGYLTMLMGECGWPRGSAVAQAPHWDAWTGWSEFSDAAFQAFPVSIPDHEGECVVEANRAGPTARFDAVLTSACRNMLAPLRERRTPDSPLNAVPSLLVANVDLRWWEESVEPGPEYRIPDWTIEEQRHAAAVTELDEWLGAIHQEVDAARGDRELAIVVVGLPRWRKAKTQQRFRDAVPALEDTRSAQLWPYAPVIAAWPRQIPTGRVVKAFCGLHDILPTLLEMANDESPPRSGSGCSQWRVWTGEEGG